MVNEIQSYLQNETHKKSFSIRKVPPVRETKQPSVHKVRG